MSNNSREVLLETQAPWDVLLMAGTISGTVSTPDILGVGTAFTTNFQLGSLIRYIDSAGKVNYGTVLSITDATHMTLTDNLPASIDALSTFYKVTNTLLINDIDGFPNSPYIITNDVSTRTLFPTKVPLYLPNNNALGQCPTPLFVGTMNRQTSAPRLKVAFFSNREGILLKSIYVRLPYQYTLADNGLDVALRYVASDFATDEIKHIGVLGRIYIQGENIEIPINQYIPPFQYAIDNDLSWGICMNDFIFDGTNQATCLAANNVNRERIPMLAQVEQPETMENLYLPVVFGLRVQHGLDMVAL